MDECMSTACIQPSPHDITQLSKNVCQLVEAQLMLRSVSENIVPSVEIFKPL